MEIFGWICLIALAAIGILSILMFGLPNVIESIKMISYKAKKSSETKRIDIDAIEDEKRTRNELRRIKKKELADKKLELANLKTDKKIKEVENEIAEVKTDKEEQSVEETEKETETPAIEKFETEVESKEETPIEEKVDVTEKETETVEVAPSYLETQAKANSATVDIQ